VEKQIAFPEIPNPRSLRRGEPYPHYKFWVSHKGFVAIAIPPLRQAQGRDFRNNLEDVQEGLRAVIEKRKPVWKNK
jgi:hypothetical protein